MRRRVGRSFSAPRVAWLSHSVRRPRDGSAGGREVALGLLEQTRSPDGLRPCPRPGAAREHRRPSPARARERQVTELERDPTGHHVRTRRLRRPVGLLPARWLRPRRGPPRRRSGRRTGRPGPLRAERAAARDGDRGHRTDRRPARRFVGTVDVTGRKTGACWPATPCRRRRRRCRPLRSRASAVSASRRASSTRFAESRTDARSARVSASCCTFPSWANRCSAFPSAARSRGRDVALQGEHVAEVLFRDRGEVCVPDGIARRDRLAEVLRAFVDAAALCAQQAEIGVSERRPPSSPDATSSSSAERYPESASPSRPSR